jgi:hypothetical protein
VGRGTSDSYWAVGPRRKADLVRNVIAAESGSADLDVAISVLVRQSDGDEAAAAAREIAALPGMHERAKEIATLALVKWHRETRSTRKVNGPGGVIHRIFGELTVNTLPLARYYSNAISALLPDFAATGSLDLSLMSWLRGRLPSFSEEAIATRAAGLVLEGRPFAEAADEYVFDFDRELASAREAELDWAIDNIRLSRYPAPNGGWERIWNRAAALAGYPEFVGELDRDAREAVFVRLNAREAYDADEALAEGIRRAAVGRSSVALES